MKGRRRVFLVLVPAAFIIFLWLVVALPSFFGARRQLQLNECMNNLRQIDSAVEGVAMARDWREGEPVNVADITPYIWGGRLPVCPSGGIYTIGRVGECRSCSIHGILNQ